MSSDVAILYVDSQRAATKWATAGGSARAERFRQ